MSTNIIEINPSAEAAKRLRQKLDAWFSATKQWNQAMLELATELWKARQMHPSNHAFGIWLAENDLLDLSSHDRAALINMASYPELTQAALKETDRCSLQHIWTDIIQPKVLTAEAAKRAAELASCSTEQDALIQTTSLEPPKSDLPTAESNDAASENELKESGSLSPPAKTAVSKTNPFRKFPRADEITAIYLEPNSRTLIGKVINKGRAGKEIWDLILQALDGGVLTPTNICFQRKLTLRLLVPGAGRSYGNRFDLTDGKDRATIRDTILPAALSCKDAVLQNPENLESIVADHVAKQDAMRRANLTAKRVEKELSELPADQQEILMYGERLWPRPDNEFYDYKELRSAIWCFRDLNRWLGLSRDPSIASRAVGIRLLVGHWYSFAHHELEGEARAKIENMAGAISKLSRLLARNPEAEAECRFPPSPKREDEW